MLKVIPKDGHWLEKCKGEVLAMAAGGNEQGDGEEGWVADRIKQLKCLSELRTLKDMAAALCEVKEAFDFTCDLENIETFQQVVGIC
jgi:hypothetical protein